MIAALIPAACKKKDADSANPGDAAAADAAPAAPAEPDVPQEPDPPDIAEGRKAYILGNYADVSAKLALVYGDLKERSQYRASGLAGGWLALGLAKDVVENAEEPARHAIAMAEKTGDPEVVAVANMALGAYQLGMEEFDGAVASLDVATKAEGGDGALAYVLHAEALIGRAYGGGGSMDLKNPQDLDAAAKSYEAGAAAAKGDALEAALLGRVEEGLAAVAKYKGDRVKICEHAKAAAAHYDTAGAANFLKEGPAALARDARCK